VAGLNEIVRAGKIKAVGGRVTAVYEKSLMKRLAK